MNTIIIAGITDSPWLVLVILLGGAVVNWLSSRRQKQAEAQGTATPTPDKPQGQFDMEAMLRKLLGQETQAPAAPPPIPRSTRPTLPPIKVWVDESEESSENVWMDATPKAIAPPRLPPAKRKTPKQPAYVSAAAGARIVGLGTGVEPRRRRSSSSGNVKWRNRGSARQAFVASLVFGPPKGMEP